MRARGWAAGLLMSMLPLAGGGAGAAASSLEEIYDAMRANRVVPPADAPDVTLPTTDGRSLRLADLRGRAVIVGFFVTG